MKSASPYFEETQWLRDTRWIWYAGLASGLTSLIPLLYMVYWQVMRGEPVGDKPMTDDGIVIFVSVFVGMMIVFIIVVRTIRLSVIIDDEGVHYNFVPSSRGWKLISKDSIVNSELVTGRSWFEHLASGYASKIITKSRRMSFQGNEIVRFRLKDRWKISIGTQRPNEFLSALKRISSSAHNTI